MLSHIISPTILTALSATGTAAISYWIWKSPTTLLGTCVLIAHEFGHYFEAKAAGATVKTPLFMPAVFTMIGGTYIKDVPIENQAQVAISGSINGLITTGLLAGVAALLGLTTVLIPILCLGLKELFSMTLGSDGRKYRLAKRSFNDTDLITNW